jgi:hypothetical protein
LNTSFSFSQASKIRLLATLIIVSSLFNMVIVEGEEWRASISTEAAFKIFKLPAKGEEFLGRAFMSPPLSMRWCFLACCLLLTVIKKIKQPDS